MGKMNELSQAIDSLITFGETLIETGRALKAFYSTEEEAKPAAEAAPKKEAPAAEKPKTYSKEDVRGLLAAKANAADGKFKATVKALVQKYGNGGTLKDIPAESYPELVKELEGLTDA